MSLEEKKTQDRNQCQPSKNVPRMLTTAVTMCF